MVEAIKSGAARVLSSRIVLGIGAAALIAFGFVIDGISEVGHHAGFVLGGMALGAAIQARSK